MTHEKRTDQERRIGQLRRIGQKDGRAAFKAHTKAVDKKIPAKKAGTYNYSDIPDALHQEHLSTSRILPNAQHLVELDISLCSNYFFCYFELFIPFNAWNLIHNIGKKMFNNRAQPTRTRFLSD